MKFAEIYWTEEDIINALDTHDIEASRDNIDKVWDALNEEELQERMIEAGWDYIYNHLPNREED